LFSEDRRLGCLSLTNKAMKIISKKFILGFIAGLILAWIMIGFYCRSDITKYEYIPGPEESIYKVDKATGDVFWIREGVVTKVERTYGKN
jgi:hypothetical protein